MNEQNNLNKAQENSILDITHMKTNGLGDIEALKSFGIFIKESPKKKVVSSL